MTQRKVAVYLRVSSKSQKEALKNQEPDLKRWEAAQEESTTWFRDTFSGRTLARPGFQKLLADVRAGKVSKLVCWRLDRLGRTTLELLQLLQELRSLNVGFHSLKDGFDLETPAGRMVFSILASVAEYETEVRKERQMSGIERIREANNGKCTWGGRKTGQRVKVSIEKERLIQKLHKDNTSISEIARTLGLTRRTIYKTLERLEV